MVEEPPCCAISTVVRIVPIARGGHIPSTKTIPWLRVFLEGAVIVASILLAFGIEAWWDRRGDDADEEVLLAVLERDMIRNREELTRVLQVEDQSLLAIGVFRTSQPNALAALPPDSAMALFQGMYNTITFSPHDEALRTHDFTILRDPQLRALLAEWSGLEADVAEDAALKTEALRGIHLSRPGQSSISEGTADDAPDELRMLRQHMDFVRRVEWKEMVMQVYSRKSSRLLAATDDILRLLRGNTD